MFFEFSPVRAPVKHETVPKETESEKVEILSLAPFTPNPKLFFEDVKVGQTVTRKLLIENPTNHDVNLFVTNNFSPELNVTLTPEQIFVEKKSSAILEVTWQPLQEEFSRYMITIGDGKRIHRDIPVAFKAIRPKKQKTGTKQKIKPQSTLLKPKSPCKSKKVSPTKKYYSTRPPCISPRRYASQKSNPQMKKSSPTKMCSINVQKASPENKCENIYPTTNYNERIRHTYRTKDKENFPTSLLNISSDSNVFVSPGSATFRLDYLQPVERRETYVVNGKKEVSLSDSIFNDSLENNSPEPSPRLVTNKPIEVRGTRRPLGMSNQENISPRIGEYIQQKMPNTPVDCNFEYKLMQLESFCFTPIATPVKQNQEFTPNLSSTAEKKLLNRNATEVVYSIKSLAAENQTFERAKSPNLSSETYVKSNVSTETYVKGNASFETYVKSNLSGGTFTKDTSIGDVANLSLSPIPSKNIDSYAYSVRAQNFNNDSAKDVIEANFWSGTRNAPLCSIKEESYVQNVQETELNFTNKSFLKRKSDLNFSFTPPKRPNTRDSPKDWSKTGGSALRIAKKTTGLNLKKFLNKTERENNEKMVVVTKQDTHQVIIQNPFLLAATNLADPFMTPHLYVNEEWLDQQQVDFKKWLNALLTPPEELSSEEQIVDVAKVWQECKKREVEAAPTKELVSSKYLVSNKLNSLRKAAQNLYRGKEMTTVLSKVVLAVETGKLSIRDDKDIHLNLSLKSEIVAMLLSYNPLWLRIGLETIYNEIIPLKSNSDVVGLSEFIANRLLKDPYLLKKHKIIHSPKYNSEFKKFFLKKFLILIYFLDQAKNKKLIPHDPCLFRKTSPIKESKEMLIKLAREVLAAVGDITKYLKYTGYVVSHVQTYIHEFDYAVKNLGVDLRDGVRLTKVMEIILMRDDLTSNLRVPAISRLQKVHNMKIVFASLEKAGYQILYDISPKDIVDGHKEKTLSFLWQIVYKFQAPLMVKSATMIQTWFRSLPVVLKRRRLERERLRRESAAVKIQTWYRRRKLVQKIEKYKVQLLNYLSLIRTEKAAVKIQSYYRMYRHAKLYKTQRNVVVNIQRFARGWLVRNVRRDQIKKAVILQSYIRMYLARQRYLKLKNAASVVQSRYRAKKKMETAHTAYIQQKTSAVIIQRWIRNIKLLEKDKNNYEKLKKATVCLQNRYRAKKLCQIETKRYREIKSATLRIQRWYRSITSMRVCQTEFLRMKSAVKVIEQRYVAYKTMEIQKRQYQEIKNACIVIQRQYKALREMRLRRQAYLELKTATITIQNRYRANVASKKEKERFQSLKSATVLLQRKFRATKAMKVDRKNYNRVREATVKIQVWIRATMQMRKCLTYYVSLKFAVCIFEERYQAKKLMVKDRERYQKLKSAAITLQRQYRAQTSMRKARTEYLRLKTATMCIQRKYRANKLSQIHRKEFVELKQSVVVVQQRFRAQIRMKECRKKYLRLQRAAVKVQRQYRANYLMKTTRNYYQNLVKYTAIVQQRFRAKKAMLEQREDYRKLRRYAIFVQKTWRAKKLGDSQKQKYEALKKSVVFVQRQWRANKLCCKDKTKYEVLRKTVINVQRIWRANKLTQKERCNYTKLKNAAIFMQRAWRAKVLKEKHNKQYLELKSATIFLQKKWRSIKLTEKCRTEFLTLRKTVIAVQQRWRANRRMRQEKQNYLCLKKAAIIIQRRWRAKKLMQHHKSQYLRLKNHTLFIQRLWRANKLAKQKRIQYLALKTAALTVQNRWKCRQLTKKERHNYLEMKKAAITLQQRWRAKVARNYHKGCYESLRRATIFVQRKWRANISSRRERIAYETLRLQVVTIQRLWRANTLARRERGKYIQLKSAVVVFQNRWRARKIGREQKIQYELLRKTTVFTQRRWRANVVARKERNRYQALRHAAIIIQSNWRRKQARNKYLQLKKSTIALQQKWRANKLCKEHKNYYESLRKATIFIQRKWRANKLAQIESEKYKALKRNAIVLQQHWRAKKQAEKDRNNYLLMKKSTIVLQRRWRARKLGERHRKYYEVLKQTVGMVQKKWRLKKVYESTRNDYLTLRKATIVIQQRWQAQRLMKIAVQRYTLLRHHTVRVQLRFRAHISMKKQRELYIKSRTAAVTIQRFYRSYISTKRLQMEFQVKRKSVLQLQRYIRGYLVRRKYAYYFTSEEREKRRIERIRIAAIVRIQALWRGHRSRSLDTPEMIKIRQRAQKANLKAEPQNTLGHRCTVALQTLVNERSTLFVVNRALEDLDYITRHSRDICKEVAKFLPEQMYLMIKTTNRSLPEMNVCILSVNILINVYKYPPTRPYSFFSEYIDNIITVMMHWCDKEAQLFPSMCTLLWLFAHKNEWKDFIISLPNIGQRLLKIQSQVSRKQSMVKRAGVKGQSLFVSYKTLPLPSLEPDWGLAYGHNSYVFNNSIHALASLLQILNL